LLLTEWEQVVDAWQLADWPACRDVARLGRKTRLPEAQREVLWSIFERVRAEPTARRLITLAEMFTLLAAAISISTMHLAKGLEFRAVVVMACDDEVIPLQERIETVGDNADLQDVYDTERHLLYVACTRARDYLLVTSGDSPSEFLDDLRM